MLERIDVLVNDSASTISLYLFELKLSSNFYVPISTFEDPKETLALMERGFRQSQ